MNHPELGHILFISIPETYTNQIGDFCIDPSVRIPIEVPHDQDIETWNPENLSWEMIVSGMLKILAYNPTHKDSDYFGQFILAVQPNAIQELTTSGIAKSQQKEYHLAQEIFLSVLRLQKEPEHYLNVAFCYGEEAHTFKLLGEESMTDMALDKAFTFYKEGLEEFPESPDLHYYMAQFCVGQESFSKALVHYKHFLKYSKDEDQRRATVQEVVDKIEGHNPLDGPLASAMDLIHMNKEDEAIAIIEESLENHKGDWNAYFLLGWAYRRKQNYSKAKSAFLKAKKENPTQIDIYNEIAICSMELHDYTGAKDTLVEALSLDSENIKVLSNLGVIALKTDDPQEALGFFSVVHDIDPEDSVAIQYLQLIKEQFPQLS